MIADSTFADLEIFRHRNFSTSTFSNLKFFEFDDLQSLEGIAHIAHGTCRAWGAYRAWHIYGRGTYRA